MNGPGDRAPKLASPQEPSLSTTAKATAPLRRMDVEGVLLPGSKSSARSESHSSGSWEISKVPRRPQDGRQPWERDERYATAVAFEKSDEAIVPRKSAKTLVTLVEPMEGRAEAAGKLAVGNAHSTQSETMRAHAVWRVDRTSARAAGGSLPRGGSPVREIRPPGSVRGAARKGGPYRNGGPS
jgi:hypothetical protein